MSNDDMITWQDNDFNSKEKAIAQSSDNIDSYAGLNKSLAVREAVNSVPSVYAL